VTKSEYRCL